jgi:zinc transporter ZupT
MPVYYACGSRWKAFMWGSLPAVAEPLGGLVAYLSLSSAGNDTCFGIIFGIVAGTMVYIRCCRAARHVSAALAALPSILRAAFDLLALQR